VAERAEVDKAGGRGAAAADRRGSEAMFAAAFRTTSIPMTISRLSDLRLLEVNDAACTRLGYDRSELIGRSATELGVLTPEAGASLARALREHGIARDLELPVRHRDGTIRHGRLSATPIEIDGEPCFVTATVDVTDRWAAEEALRATEIRFTAAFSFSGVMMLISRLRDGLIVNVNQAFLDQSGYERDEVIGRTSTDLSFFAHPEDRDQMAEILRRDGRVRDFEIPVITRDGELNWALISADVTMLDGEPHLIVAVINTTVRKRAEDALRTSEERFRGLVEQTADGVLLLDDEGRIVDANPAMAGLLGSTADELLGKRWTDYIDPSDLAQLPFQQPPPGQGQSLTFERKLRRSDGSTVEVEVHTRQFVNGGLLGTARDIGPRKAAERERARFLQLTAAVSALDATLRASADEESLFRGTVHVLVSVGGLAVASVALVEPAGRLRVQAVARDEKRLAADIRISEVSLGLTSEHAGRALETGHACVYPYEDPEEHDDRTATMAGLGVVSEAAIPIGAGRLPVGIIAVLTDDPSFFGEPEVELLEQMAALVAARLGDIERQEREHVLAAALASERAEAERFAAMTATIDRSLERVSKLDDLYREACRLPVDLGVCVLARFGLVEADMKGRRLRFVASIAQDASLEREVDAWLGRSMPVSYTSDPPTPVTSTMVVNDVLGDPRFRRRHQPLREAGLCAIVAVPVFKGPYQAGSMAFYAREVGAFGTHEVALLDRLSVDVGHCLAALESERDGRLARRRTARLVGRDTANGPAEQGPTG